MSFKCIILCLLPLCVLSLMGSPTAIGQDSWDLDWDASTPPPNPPFADPRGGGETVAAGLFIINGTYNVLNWIGATGEVLGIGGANNTTGVTIEIAVRILPGQTDRAFGLTWVDGPSGSGAGGVGVWWSPGKVEAGPAQDAGAALTTFVADTTDALHVYRLTQDANSNLVTVYVDDGQVPVIVNAAGDSTATFDPGRVHFGRVDTFAPSANAMVEIDYLRIHAGSTPPAPTSTYTGTIPDWTSDRRFRVLVETPPTPGLSRPADELVAQVDIDFDQHLEPGQQADLSSLQVVEFDPDTGAVIDFPGNVYASTTGDRPLRFYDAAIPWNYPYKFGYAYSTNGTSLPNEYMEGGGRYFNAFGDGQQGALAWAHTQRGNDPSYYAAYFDALEDPTQPRQAPAGFVGDGSHRCTDTSTSFFPIDHSRIDVADWDGDGLFDLIVGDGVGSLRWHKNLGQAGQPEFDAPRIIFEDNGEPADAGWSAAPRAFDWDFDGDLDLLVGTERGGVIVFFRNNGTPQSPSLHREGLLQADGAAIELPNAPVICDPNNEIFTLDYYSVLDVVDWDGDGDQDLLAGGATTGYIWYYQNVAPSPIAEPQLTFQGPLQADGADLDVTWHAAPTVADFDDDGDLDLICGAMQQNTSVEGCSDHTDPARVLWYFENVGTRTSPVLELRFPFPSSGSLGNRILATPRVIDYNGDGLLDLIFSARQELVFVPNLGTLQDPLFYPLEPTPIDWGNALLGFQHLLDYNEDGWADAFYGTSVGLNDGQGMPGFFNGGSVALPGSGLISHPSPSGDVYEFRYLADLDGDAQADILFGDHGGQVWFHEDLGTPGNPQIEPNGVSLQVVGGGIVEAELVPPIDPFDELQGARTQITVGDYNKDTWTDILVANTQGYIYLFLRVPGGLTFQPRVTLGRLHQIRLTVQTLDLNDDGWDDILASYAGGQIHQFINQAVPGTASFDPPVLLDHPAFNTAWPLTYVGDWNGDGDVDVIISVFGIVRFLERSFLDHGYVAGAIVSSEGFCGDPFADDDRDGDVDQEDFGRFQVCFTTTPGDPVPPECLCFDHDGDEIVSLSDFAVFQACMSGPQVPADPACDEGS